jgi:integrase
MTVLCGFFSHARRLGLIDSNPADREHLERPRMDEHLPETFSVTSVEKLLTVASRTAPHLVPYLAVGFFAGLRTSELNGLEWSAIDMDQRLITVRPEIAKKRRQRHVDISDNLLAWLQRHRKHAGRLRPKNTRNDLDGVIKAAGVEWVHNGMRHTFASCHLATHNDISKTCIQLGHTGNPSVLFNHYRNLVKPADAESYWRIRPPVDTASVLSFPKTA